MMELRPITRQIAMVGLIAIALTGLFLNRTDIVVGVVTGIFALLKGEVKH